MLINIGDKNLSVIIYTFFERSNWLTFLVQFFAVYAIFFLGATAIWLAVKKQWQFIIYSSAGIALLWLINQGLNWLISRPRPFVALSEYIFQPLITDASIDPSFPSDHSLVAFALATFLAKFFANRQITVILYLWASLIAFSRVAVGVHYPTDIIIGALIGYLGALVCYKQYNKVKR